MKEHKKEKTNVMRLLDAAGIPYRTMEYEVDEHDLSGIHVARQLGQEPDTCFIALICAEPPTRDTLRPGFTAGRKPELNISVSR